MSIASLSRFTVPLASNQSSSTQGMLMPKLKYRFRVSFENFGGLLGDCKEVFGVEVEVFIEDSVMFFLLDVLSEDGVDLHLVHLTTGALSFWFCHNFI